MIYFIRRGLRIDAYHRASYPRISELLWNGQVTPLEGYIEKAGFYYLSVFPTTGFERNLHSLLHELTRQQKRKVLC